jgi:hypothetical protein
MLTLALLLCVLTAGVAVGKLTGAYTWSPPVAEAATGTFYGVNQNMLAVAAADWPQKDPNWCGVATIELVVNYTYQLASGNANYFPFDAGGQQQIVNDLNSSAGVSQWGTAPPTSQGPGFKADIAADGGTDPRSIAWGILYESVAGQYLHVARPGYVAPKWAVRTYSYHNVIYHGDVQHAVGGLARALERFQLPISVTMAHGLHSDVVSGVYSNNDPIASYPADVDAVNTWDPAVGTATGGYQQSRMVTWSNYTFNTDPNMWGTRYDINGGYDPDPSVGIYTPTNAYPHHWITFLTDIEPDTQINLSPDFALDENGNVMNHP